jgi:uncharacterized Ntn-hydrolase superfamily protein
VWRAVTYSLVARDPETSELGVAVQSHWFSVGAVVTHARAGAGAVATQSVPDPAHGPRILDLLQEGASPDEALDSVLKGDEAIDFRQTAVVDVKGRVAVHTGPGCMQDAGHTTGDGWSCQANMMSSAEVWPAMAEAFVASKGRLAERLVAALQAADAAGGDVRGRQSAALLVVPAIGEPWRRTVELRVEDHPDPVTELARLLHLQRAYAHAGDGDEAMAEGRIAEAGELFVRASELAPEKEELLFWAGLALASAGEFDEGVSRVRRAISANRGLAVLLERLTEDIAPAAARVRQAL